MKKKTVTVEQAHVDAIDNTRTLGYLRTHCQNTHQQLLDALRGAEVELKDCPHCSVMMYQTVIAAIEAASFVEVEE